MLNLKKLSFFLFLFSSAWILGVDGDLDPTFGIGGLVITDFGGFDANSRVGAHIQIDGKIVVFSNTTAGQAPTPNFALARYLANGNLDNTFGNNGLVITDLGGGESSGDIAIQADGKIVVAGTSGGTLALVRYNTNGTLDNTFGINGVVRNGSISGSVDIVIQPDQLIVISGTTGSGPNPSNFALARFLSNGNLDLTFGTNGIVVTDFGGSESSTAVAIQQDGKILAGGSTNQGPNPNNFAIARYNKNGILDTTFGANGLVITDFATGTDSAHDIAVQADGKILVSGVAFGADGDLAVARYNKNGSLDITFGSSGLAIIDFGDSESPLRASIGIQGDGKILVSGTTDEGANPRNFAIARLLTNGLIDTSFGVNGLVITDFNGRDDTSNTVAIQEDGKFIVVGFTQNGSADFGVARYLSTPALAPITITQPAANNGNPILSGTAQNLSSITILADGVPVCSTFTQGTGLVGTWTCSPASIPNGTFDIKAVSTYYAGRINLETDTIEVTFNRSTLSQAIRNKYCSTP